MQASPYAKKAFKRMIWGYYKRHGRHTLPWRNTRDPYAILVSEIMLQQTQVSRVEGYYERFLKKFPTFEALARAHTSEVLALWQGLGYNRRALALQRTAKIVVKEYHGNLPDDRDVLQSLPGIGKGTSGSLMAFAFNKPVVFIETNIRRVFIHYFFKGQDKVTDEEVERYILCVHETKNPREWYWALMDYGSSMKKRENANVKSAHYRKQTPFAGSDRELRGRLLRVIMKKKRIHEQELCEILQAPDLRTTKIVAALSREGFLKKKNGYLQIE